jgi:hypothetical protein
MPVVLYHRFLSTSALERVLPTIGKEPTPIVTWRIIGEPKTDAESTAITKEASRRALGYLKRFGSVTVLDGHIHRIIQKLEGNVTFHTAASTAFPQPALGTAPAPGPMKEVPAGELHKYLGIRTVNYLRGKGVPALTDSTLVA